MLILIFGNYKLFFQPANMVGTIIYDDSKGYVSDFLVYGGDVHFLDVENLPVDAGQAFREYILKM